MRRRLFTLCSALSLLLFLLIAFSWVRSYGLRADVWYLPGLARHFVEAYRGQLCFGWHLPDGPTATQSFCVPHIIPLGVAAVLPARWFALRLRHGRRHAAAGFEVVRPSE